MNVRDIVRKAWQVTQVHLKKLIWYGAVPAFFTIFVSGVYLAYQYNAFRKSALFTDQTPGLVGDLRTVWSLITLHPKFTVAIVILAIAVLVGYIILPPIFKGALIHGLMRIKNYKPIKGSIEVGIRKFFPLFEFAIITGAFSIITLFSEASFILRWWGQNVFFLALPVLLFIATIGLIASFLFTYSEYFIVLKDQRLIEAMKESVILVIANLRKTILVFILMLLIGARVILNVILVLFIPMGIAALSTYLATLFLNKIAIAFIVLIGLAILLVASYLMGLFNVFTTAVWVLTFSVLAEKEEEPIKDVDLEKNS